MLYQSFRATGQLEVNPVSSLMISRSHVDIFEDISVFRIETVVFVSSLCSFYTFLKT